MQLQLDKQEVFNLGDDLRAVRILCRSGCCWLTQAGDDRDHILRAGRSCTITRRGRVLVLATVETRLQLIAEPAGDQQVSLWRRLVSGRKKNQWNLLNKQGGRVSFGKPKVVPARDIPLRLRRQKS